jgi:hypothetical protein
MRPINPVHHLRIRQPQLAQKIYFPKPINTLGHDSLLTPQRLPVGETPEPFRDVPITFASGAWLDVVNQ